MTAYTGGPASRTCPNCNYPIPPGRRALCPNCHHPLIFDEQDEKPGAIADTGLVKPTRTDDFDNTVIAQPMPPPPLIGGPPGRTCQSCGHVNPPNQLRCERCATSLDQQPAMPLPPPPPPPPPPSRTGLAVAVVAVALVARGRPGFRRVPGGAGRQRPDRRHAADDDRAVPDRHPDAPIPRPRRSPS